MNSQAQKNCSELSIRKTEEKSGKNPIQTPSISSSSVQETLLNPVESVEN